MKKIVMVICVISLLLISALAGDIPEALMSEDGAQIFFGEVVSYEPEGEIPYVEVIPTEKIKGDVIVGSCGTWQKANTMGDFDVKIGETYLFTYLDASNSTDIFEVTSLDVSSLKIKNVSGDMWERFEKYLHEGRYLEAEQERIERENERLISAGKDISLKELIGVAREDAKEVKIHYNQEFFDVDAEKFYDAIEEIMLRDIEDVSLVKEVGDTVSLPNGMYITVNGFDGFAFITDDCKVDKCGMHMSRIPIGAYVIDELDRAKIMALFNEEELPFVETPLAKKILYVVLFAIVFVPAVGFGVGKSRRR